MNVNIEKSVLATIIFDNSCFHEISKIVNSSDFSDIRFKKIYETMLVLDKKDDPIEETFLLKNGADENTIIDIMSVNAITNVIAYAKELKRDSILTQIKLLTLKLNESFDEKLIDQINDLNEKLKSIEDFKTVRKYDSSRYKKFNINHQLLENFKIDYVIDNFIVKNDITMIAAAPSDGKSINTIAIANMALSSDKIKYCHYIDGDNGTTTIKNRSIDQLQLKWGDRLVYHYGATQAEYTKHVGELKKDDLTDLLVVIDTIKNFMVGLDRNNNKDATTTLMDLIALRKRGATVIFLHHTNKPQKDVEVAYAGAAAFREDAGFAYILKRNQDKNFFIFTKIKDRDDLITDVAFSLDFVNHYLHKLDLEFAKETKEDAEINHEIVDFILSCNKPPIWSDIYNYLLENGYEKNKVSKAIKNGEGRLWKVEKGTRNNQKLYFLIDQGQKEPIKTVFESKAQKVTSGTPITSGSLFYGLSEFSDSSREVREVKQILPILANDKFVEIPFIE